MLLANHSRLLIVNFGGPRDEGEIPSFLRELLTDRDVIRSGLPQVIHNWVFGRVARKRAVKIAEDYRLIGGRSPIYADTEALALAVREKLNMETLTFHRYLAETHPSFLERMQHAVPTLVFPLFPQFSYATTGSIARWLQQHLSPQVLAKMHWIKSYPEHCSYIAAFQQCIRAFLEQESLTEEEVILLFSAHGLPEKFIQEGDSYQQECEASYAAIAAGFPQASSQLSYQSKFGRGEWLRPYTEEVCREVKEWNPESKTVVVVPLSFTSDHIETLFEIEYQYVAEIKKQGIRALRCPALNLSPYWIDAIAEILQSASYAPTSSLIFSKPRFFTSRQMEYGQNTAKKA